MAERITTKFCENCGKTNVITAKFCKSCGNTFPEIDIPSFNENPPPQSGPQVPTKPVYPTNVNQPPPMSQPPPTHGIPQNAMGTLAIDPPRAWTGGGILDAIRKFYTKPTRHSAELLEDPKSPSPTILVVLSAVVFGVFFYLQFMTLEFVSVDVAPEYENYFSSQSGRQSFGLTSAAIFFVVIMILWLFGSWLLGNLVRGGLPNTHYVRYNSTRSMRKLTAYLSIPYTLKNILMCFMLLNEKKRQAQVSSSSGSYSFPRIDYITQYSNNYYNISFLSGFIFGFIAAIIFYRVLTRGLGYKGILPGILSVLMVFVGMNL